MRCEKKKTFCSKREEVSGLLTRQIIIFGTCYRDKCYLQHLKFLSIHDLELLLSRTPASGYSQIELCLLRSFTKSGWIGGAHILCFTDKNPDKSLGNGTTKLDVFVKS